MRLLAIAAAALMVTATAAPAMAQPGRHGPYGHPHGWHHHHRHCGWSHHHRRCW